MGHPAVVAFASRQPIPDLTDEHAILDPIRARLIAIEASDAADLTGALGEVDLVVNRWGQFTAEIIHQLDRCRAIVQQSFGDRCLQPGSQQLRQLDRSRSHFAESSSLR